LLAAILLVALHTLFAGFAGAQSVGNQDTTQSAGKATGASVGHCGRAPSGSGHGNVDYVMVYKSNQSIVCVDSTFWAIPANASAISTFFPYLDAVIAQDKALFPVAVPAAPFVFEITVHTGGAHTGCDFPGLSHGGFCNTVTGDAFTAAYVDPVSRKRVHGFWGYLLPLHESINVFTGLLSVGWPTDWWADHRSPFPNAMDAEFMQSIADGDALLDPATKRALFASAKLQLERFTDPANPTGEYDTQIVMFVDFFNKYGGFRAYADSFRYAIGQDHLQWPAVSGDNQFTGDNNYSENLSEYIIAYLHLGFGADTNLTSVFRNAGVGSKDTKIPSYELDDHNVRAIADAHCSIRAAANAGFNVSRELAALQKGNFKHALASGGTVTSCPGECAFSNNQCVAKF